MSDTAVKTQDTAAATDALRIRFGNYILHGARQNPIGALNTVLLAWEEEPVRSQDYSRFDFIPGFRNSHTIDGLINEVVVFTRNRRDWAQGLADSFAGNLDALSESLVEEVAEQNRASVLTEIGEAVDRIASFHDASEEPDPEVDTLAEAAASAERNARERLGALGIVALRKRSKGLVKGGYSLPKTDLIDALVALGDLGL